MGQNTFPSSGNVGIGTTNPSHKLDINTGKGNLKTYAYGLEHTVNITGGWSRGCRLRNEHDNKTTVFGSLDGAAYISTGFDINADATGWRNQKFTVLTNGNVGIGTTKPDEKLTVKGKIHAEEVRVDLAVPADYVFQHYYDGISSLKENYTMPTLEEVAAFTKKNHHLPAIPSAKEIQKEGLHLKEMTNLLLQKIEELTIYTIEQEKRIKALESKLVEKKS